MRKHLESRAIVGALAWVGIIAVSIMAGRKSLSDRPLVARQLVQYVGTQRRSVELESDYNLILRVGDPVFLYGSDSIAPIGKVSEVVLDKNSYATAVTVSMYGNAPELSDDDHFEYHYSENSAAWVVKTMLTPEKRNEITKIIMASYEQNQLDVVRALQPVVEASLRDASEVLQDDFRKAIESRESQLNKMGLRFQNELVEKEIIPLIQSEIWPLVRDESTELANEVGQEIWNEVSMFRFGWRYVYDQTPFTGRNLTEREFNRFVNSKVVPILESHMSDFLVLQNRLARKILANRQVVKTISSSLETVAKDDEVQQLVAEIFREVIVDNKRLREVLEDRWRTPQAQAALALANKRIEPTITQIGVSLFGSPRDSITPEFSNVLRYRILNKDGRWLTLHEKRTKSSGVQSDPALAPTVLPLRLSESDDPIPSARARVRH